mmetsp:Transcript_24774/g.34144  ORF Transcript_24774/g.34144 Transcript_24774/m.34144 type:complete len:216 (+) Transcript_24774:1703-2350(+)
MSPPQLPGNAPIPNVLQPVPVHLVEPIWDDLEFPRVKRLQSGLGQWGHFDEPLRRNERLNNLAASLRSRHAVLVRLSLDHQAVGLHVFPQLRAGVEPVHRRVLPGLGIERPVLVHDVDNGQPNAFPNLVVVHIVARGDLESSSSKFHVHVVIGDDRNQAPATSGHHTLLADQMLVPLILWVHCDGGVPQNCLWASGGHRQELSLLPGHRVLEEEQ